MLLHNTDYLGECFEVEMRETFTRHVTLLVFYCFFFLVRIILVFSIIYEICLSCKGSMLSWVILFAKRNGTKKTFRLVK